MKNMSRSWMIIFFPFWGKENVYCRHPFIPSWTKAMIVNLPVKGPQEVRLSEDLEDQDIKAGGDDFQKELARKYSSFSDVQDGDGHGRGGGWDSPVLSFRHHFRPSLKVMCIWACFHYSPYAASWEDAWYLKIGMCNTSHSNSFPELNY